MTRWNLAFVLVVLVGLSQCSGAYGNEARIELHMTGEPGVMLWSLDATGLTQTVDIPVRYIPKSLGTGGASMFRVIDMEGNKCEYKGLIRKVDPNAMVQVKPGDSLKYTVDLTRLYEFEHPGSYYVTFPTRTIHTHQGDIILSFGTPKTFFMPHASSPPLPPQASHDLDLGLPSTSISFTTVGCSDQNPKLTALIREPLFRLYNGLTLVTSETPYPSFFSSFFGEESTSSWETVQGHYQAVKDTLESSNVRPNCGGDQCDAITYAYVFPTDVNHNIYLCDVYFGSDIYYGNYDTCSGTLLHETLHFSDVVGTLDFAYGVDDCHNLAETNPTQAMLNSDSHQYYLESHWLLTPCAWINNCDDCGSETGCSWCVDEEGFGMCVQSSPFYGVCPDLNPSCTISSDPCASYSTCDTCTEDKDCGWCDEACVSGNSVGPADHVCSTYNYFSCEADCSSATNCSSCVMRDCGFCASTQTCVPGTFVGAENTCDHFQYLFCECSAGAKCSDCFEISSYCGWCSSNDFCASGTSPGPYYTDECPSSSSWFYNTCPCDYDTEDDCLTEQGQCGWCNDDGSCNAGNENGPFLVGCDSWFGVSSSHAPYLLLLLGTLLAVLVM
ncbi:peptidase M35 [Pelomyxa schiedti]|nr:peptidase M35 [Pelomyxa schiedti]